jgi:hypothetical protein
MCAVSSRSEGMSVSTSGCSGRSLSHRARKIERCRARPDVPATQCLRAGRGSVPVASGIAAEARAEPIGHINGTRCIFRRLLITLTRIWPHGGRGKKMERYRFRPRSPHCRQFRSNMPLAPRVQKDIILKIHAPRNRLPPRQGGEVDHRAYTVRPHPSRTTEERMASAQGSSPGYGPSRRRLCIDF